MAISPMRIAYTISILVVARYTIRYLLCIALRDYGYVVYEAGTEEDGLGQLQTNQPDLVILELTSERDALKFIKEFRQRTPIPLVVMSTNDEDRVKAAALDTGADDYVSNALSNVELLARLRAILRRAAWMPTTTAVDFGDVSLDVAARSARVGAREVRLTLVEARLLYMLLIHLGKVVTYQQLLAYLWGQFSKKEVDLLRTNMYRLRQKLEPDALSPLRIITEPQIGYRLCLDCPPELIAQNELSES